VNREKRESLRTGEPIHYETTAIAQHKHGESWHEHDWSEGDGHSHGGTMRQPAEPTGEVIGEHPTRLHGPTVFHDRRPPWQRSKELKEIVLQALSEGANPRGFSPELKAVHAELLTKKKAKKK
jgi:hypothetical protein